MTDAGGTVRVELNHWDTSQLPDGFRLDNADHRILSVAHHLQREGASVVLVSKDLPLRLKAGVIGVEATEFRDAVLVYDRTGYRELDAPVEMIGALYANGVVDFDEARDLPSNCGVILANGSQSALGRLREDRQVHLIRQGNGLFGVHPRSSNSAWPSTC